MFFIPDHILDSIISEDIPFGDLTTHVIGIGKQNGIIKFTSRNSGIVSSTEEVVRILQKFGATVDFTLESGTAVQQGTSIIEAHGSADSLHGAWKICGNILDYYSAVASRTFRLVDILKKNSSKTAIGGTRKMIPGTRLLTAKAVVSGGGTMHRLGLSETVLLFKQHLTFLDTTEQIRSKINTLKAELPERKIFIELNHVQELDTYLDLNIDGIQMDKISPVEIEKAVFKIKSVNSSITVIATGGINESNIGQYASCGADVIATSSIYYGAPFDVGVTISKA
jgi:molybdenum transport protein